MEKDYTFEMFWEDLDNGFQLNYNYMGYRYLIYKLGKNSYKNQLIDTQDKCPHPKNAVYTLKRVREIFPYMEDLQYHMEV